MSSGVGRFVGVILRSVRAAASVCVLARPRRVDSGEVDVGVDGAEGDAEADEHQQNDETHKHVRVTCHSVPARARTLSGN